MIHLSILNLEEKIFDGNVESITIPGEAGELTILPNHVPIVTAIKKGAISATVTPEERYEGDLPATASPPAPQARALRAGRELQAGKKKYFESKGGIFEFTNNEATILL